MMQQLDAGSQMKTPTLTRERKDQRTGGMQARVLHWRLEAIYEDKDKAKSSSSRWQKPVTFVGHLRQGRQRHEETLGTPYLVSSAGREGCAAHEKEREYISRLQKPLKRWPGRLRSWGQGAPGSLGSPNQPPGRRSTHQNKTWGHRGGHSSLGGKPWNGGLLELL